MLAAVDRTVAARTTDRITTLLTISAVVGT
jgi:hypothetical protein